MKTSEIKNEMGRACSTDGIHEERHTKFYSEKLKEEITR
jgi:hypothetical protein